MYLSLEVKIGLAIHDLVAGTRVSAQRLQFTEMLLTPGGTHIYDN